ARVGRPELRPLAAAPRVPQAPPSRIPKDIDGGESRHREQLRPSLARPSYVPGYPYRCDHERRVRAQLPPSGEAPGEGGRALHLRRAADQAQGYRGRTERGGFDEG